LAGDSADELVLHWTSKLYQLIPKLSDTIVVKSPQNGQPVLGAKHKTTQFDLHKGS
jgi:hypothetical protein